MRKTTRILGSLLIVAGVLTLAWVVLVWRWEDPFTAVYTHFQQARLSSTYEKRAAAFHPRVTHGDLASVQRQVATEARVSPHAAHGRTGRPAAHRPHRAEDGRRARHRPRVAEEGARPLHRQRSAGRGHLIYVAGHRTTYLAPFAAINNIRAGDYIRFELPYGTFTYRVTRHYVVADNAVEVLKDHGVEILRLQACHPRFFATHRYLVDAKLVGVSPRGGAAYAPVRSASS